MSHIVELGYNILPQPHIVVCFTPSQADCVPTDAAPFLLLQLLLLKTTVTNSFSKLLSRQQQGSILQSFHRSWSREAPR